ncbi:MAG: hypothetical protein V1735_03065 [Nanoarchaeota archaeon]
MRVDEKLLERIRRLGLPEGKPENNEYLLLKVQGDGIRADPKFNVKVYRGKEGLKISTNDEHTLRCLIDNIPMRPSKVARTLSIDDSGVGFLLGGVLCGLHDSLTDRIYTVEVPTRFFQRESRLKQLYLEAYARSAVSLVEHLHPDKATTLIRICTGHVNTKAKDALRKLGYFVEVAEIKGKLQDNLEAMHKEYVWKTFGYDGYVDPKHCTSRELAIEFSRLRKWVQNRGLQRFCKEGWGLESANHLKQGERKKQHGPLPQGSARGGQERPAQRRHPHRLRPGQARPDYRPRP